MFDSAENLAEFRTATFLAAAALACGVVGCSGDKSTVEGGAQVAPGHTIDIGSLADDPTAANADQPDPEGERIRKNSQAQLSAAGFHCASSLPTAGHRAFVAGKLRPAKEVALRLMALEVLFTWVAMPDSEVATDLLTRHVKMNNLTDHMTESERQIIQLSRSEANQQHVGSIGWRLENMWALAWIVGFAPEPEATTGQIAGEISRAMVLEFVPKHGTSVDEFLAKAKIRSQQEVIELEDLFYCSHNAVRSAQTGSTTAVPEGFHPISEGGAIHERRHSLTWAISAGVAWDDTDLST